MKNKDNLVRVNLNENVKFILSQKGLDIYKKEMEKLNGKCIKYQFPTYPKRDDKGFVSEQLWSVISMYGKSIGLGLESPFADNCIYFEINEEKIDD